jgi:hypothetical protein
VLAPPRQITLEYALEFINADELVEVTSESIRLRKMVLDHDVRRRYAKNRQTSTTDRSENRVERRTQPRTDLERKLRNALGVSCSLRVRVPIISHECGADPGGTLRAVGRYRHDIDFALGARPDG